MIQNQTKEKQLEVYRYYEVRTSDSLPFLISYDIKTLGLQNKYLHELIKTGNVISKETIEKLFISYLFQLTNTEATNFFRILNIIRVTKSISVSSPQPASDNVYGALKLLKQKLPQAIIDTLNNVRNHNPYKPKSNVEREHRILKGLLSLQQVVDDIDMLDPIIIEDLEKKSWHVDVIKILLMILKCTNERGIKPSIKWLDAPVIVVIQKLLKMTQVGQFSNDAIVQAIKRYPHTMYIKHLVQ